jgi:hypothetical protein
LPSSLPMGFKAIVLEVIFLRKKPIIYACKY